MTKYRVVLDGHPAGFNTLTVEGNKENNESELITRFPVKTVFSVPMVSIDGWLIACDRIVAIVREDVKERQQVKTG